IATALGGEVAADPRRWADASFDFAVVCSAAEPRRVLDTFEALPSIVSVLEREERRAVGVTVEGLPVELVAAEPARFGTELLSLQARVHMSKGSTSFRLHPTRSLCTPRWEFRGVRPS